MSQLPNNDSKTCQDHSLLKADTWIFDLDNTLYPASCRLFDQVDKNITKFIMSFLSLDWTEAHTLQKKYFRQYGTSMNGLMKLHNADPLEFLDFVHKIDLSKVEQNPRMSAVLAKLPGRKLIFTNGSTAHAEGVMDALGVTHHFEGIFDIVAANYNPKPNPRAYKAFIEDYAINPLTAVMVEDMACNLVPAHEMGMSCVWIASDSDWARAGSDESHVHYVVDDLTNWLEVLCEKTEAKQHN